MTPVRTASLTPQWFTVVMGTSIVATAAHALPVRSPALDALAWAAWALAGSALAITSIVAARRLAAAPTALRDQLLHPDVAPLFGAPAMGLLAFGTATLLVTEPVLGGAAVAADAALWVVGTAIGLATAIAVPALAFTRHRVGPDGASAAWLMPVVPPMVSAAAGALLLPHLDGTLAQSLALACYAMAGAAGIAALVITTQVWSRLAHRGTGPARGVPSLWMVLGPLGQGTTAMGLLGDHAGPALGVPTRLLVIAAVAAGVPAMGFALLWLAIVGLITADALRRGLPFSLGWWAFTFPVGTLVTGAASLASHTGAPVLSALAIGLFALLLGGWAAAATGTARHLRAQRVRDASGRGERAVEPGDPAGALIDEGRVDLQERRSGGEHRPRVVLG